MTHEQLLAYYNATVHLYRNVVGQPTALLARSAKQLHGSATTISTTLASNHLVDHEICLSLFNMFRHHISSRPRPNNQSRSLTTVIRSVFGCARSHTIVHRVRKLRPGERANAIDDSISTVGGCPSVNPDAGNQHDLQQRVSVTVQRFAASRYPFSTFAIIFEQIVRDKTVVD